MSNLTTTSNGLIRTNVFLAVAEKKALKKRAKIEGVSFATLVRAALAQFLGVEAEQFKCVARRGVR